MICPTCGSSHIHRVKRFNSETEEYFCYDCEHFHDREDVKDANENREERE